MTPVERMVHRGGLTVRVLDDHPTRPADDPNNVNFWSLFETATWERGLETVLARFLTPTSTFVDVGAWVGPVSFIASGMCAQVLAVEPDPVARAFLVENLRLSGIQNVTVDPRAVTPDGSPARLGRKAAGALGDSMTSVLYGVDAFHAQGVALRDLVDGGTALVKMDVEGAEAEILGPSVDALRAHGVPLLLSLHAPLRPDPDRYQMIVRDALSGFAVQFVDGESWGDFATLVAIP